MALLVTSLALMEQGYVYLCAIQAGGYALALAGWGLARVGVHERLTAAAFTFCMLNYAALVGAIRFAMRDPDLWRKAS